jgi:hypothetical protein
MIDKRIVISVLILLLIASIVMVIYQYNTIVAQELIIQKQKLKINQPKEYYVAFNYNEYLTYHLSENFSIMIVVYHGEFCTRSPIYHNVQDAMHYVHKQMVWDSNPSSINVLVWGDADKKTGILSMSKVFTPYNSVLEYLSNIESSSSRSYNDK